MYRYWPKCRSPGFYQRVSRTPAWWQRGLSPISWLWSSREPYHQSRLPAWRSEVSERTTPARFPRTPLEIKMEFGYPEPTLTSLSKVLSYSLSYSLLMAPRSISDRLTMMRMRVLSLVPMPCMAARSLVANQAAEFSTHSTEICLSVRGFREV